MDLRTAQIDHETTDHIANKEFSDVLMIVTGGTLCNEESENGYQQPVKGLAS